MATFIFTPGVALAATISTIVSAARTGDWSVSNLKNNYYQSYAKSLMVSGGFQAFGAGSIFDSITFEGTSLSLMSSIFVDQFTNNSGYRNLILDWYSQLFRATTTIIQLPPKPEHLGP